MSNSIDLPETPAGAGPKKTAGAAPRSAARKAAKPSASTARRTPRKRKTPAPAAAPQMPDQDAINRMVAEAAYYIAERRSFAPGFEEADWQAAKEQIAAQLRGATRPVEG
jgi:hypothetical protein